MEAIYCRSLLLEHYSFPVNYNSSAVENRLVKRQTQKMRPHMIYGDLALMPLLIPD